MNVPRVESTADIIARLSSTIDRELLAAIPASVRRVAIVAFPNYSNVGDSAIWLGQLAYCRARGLDIVDVCDRRTYSRRRLNRRLGSDGMILVTGGGNFGDLFPKEQLFRERVIHDFPERRIVQLPQSIHFRTGEALERAARVFDTHPGLTLLLRDKRSLATARQHFRAVSALCPDMAFSLGSVPRPAAASVNQLWLWRTDIEAPPGADAAREISDEGVRVVDWLEEPPFAWRRWNRNLTRPMVRRPRVFRWLGAPVQHTFEPLARERVRRGCALLAQGRLVVTNRLHAHILCVLMNIPHVLLDNSYGKVHGFAETWGTLSSSALVAGTVAEAQRIADSLCE